MSKILIVGDPHIGKGLNIGKQAVGAGLNSRIIDQMNILDWIFNLCLEKSAKRIIITGDVFEDVKPDYYIVVLFIDWLKKCELHNIHVDIVLGNHETKRSGNIYTTPLDIMSMSGMDNVSVYKDIYTIHLDGASFTFLPFRDRRSLNAETTKEAIEKISSVLSFELPDIPVSSDKVLVGHLALEGSLPIGDEFDDIINEIMCPLNMFSGYDYVWMGHVHRPQVRSKKPYIAHIGSMDLSDFGETDHVKNVVLFDTENSNKFTNIPIPSRPLRRIKLTVPTGNDATEFLCDKLDEMHSKKSFEKAIVKLEIKLEDPEAIGLNKDIILDKIYNEFNAHHISSFSESKNVSVVVANMSETVETTINPSAALKLWIDKVELDDEERTMFIDFANKTMEEYKN